MRFILTLICFSIIGCAKSESGSQLYKDWTTTTLLDRNDIPVANPKLTVHSDSFVLAYTEGDGVTKYECACSNDVSGNEKSGTMILNNCKQMENSLDDCSFLNGKSYAYSCNGKTLIFNSTDTWTAL